MSKIHSLTGLEKGSVDFEKQQIRFTLSVNSGKRMHFSVDIASIDQIISSLANMANHFRPHLTYLHSQSKTETVYAEEILAGTCDREVFGKTLLRLESQGGIRYTFALNESARSGIIAGLRNQTPPGPDTAGTA